MGIRSVLRQLQAWLNARGRGVRFWRTRRFWRERIRLHGRLRLEIRDGETGTLKHVTESANVLCLAGEQLLAGILDGEAVYGSQPVPQGATWLAQVFGAVGTGSGTPGSGNTQLFTELDRIGLALSGRNTLIVTFTFFFPSNRANGTITEGGVFLMGSSTVNSGLLLDHAMLGSVAKNTTETATLQATFTWS